MKTNISCGNFPKLDRKISVLISPSLVNFDDLKVEENHGQAGAGSFSPTTISQVSGTLPQEPTSCVIEAIQIPTSFISIQLKA